MPLYTSTHEARRLYRDRWIAEHPNERFTPRHEANWTMTLAGARRLELGRDEASMRAVGPFSKPEKVWETADG